MFEIGTTLRDARVRRNISLQQAGDDTKIRVKYIQAMENEDFDVLPGGTYVKGFLRTYADYLGVDFQVVLDEYNERFGASDIHEHTIQPPRTAKPKAPRKHQNFLFVAILAVAIIAALAYLGWGNSSSHNLPPVPAATGATTTAAVPAAPAAAATQTQAQTGAAPGPATVTDADAFQSITFKSSSQRNWVGIYKDSNLSSVIWGDTLAPGESKTLDNSSFASLTAVWMDVGSTDGLEIKVNGQDQKISGPGIYKVTPNGIAGSGEISTNSSTVGPG